MSAMQKLIKKNNKGFSLVELIVVILIIGILAVAIAPQVTKWVGKADENQAKNELATVVSAVQVATADFLSTGGKITAETKFKIPTSGAITVDETGTTTDGTEGSLLSKVQEVITDKPAKEVAVTITTAGGVTAKRVE